MTWTLLLTHAVVGVFALAAGHILGAGWPDLQVRHVLLLERHARLESAARRTVHAQTSALDADGARRELALAALYEAGDELAAELDKTGDHAQ